MLCPLTELDVERHGRCKVKKYEGDLPAHFEKWRGKTWIEILVMFFWDRCCNNALPERLQENIFCALFKQVFPHLAPAHA